MFLRQRRTQFFGCGSGVSGSDALCKTQQFLIFRFLIV